ncbi:MAG: hypothetical protein A2162_07025 [Deltaproteobacteria bacterium RBG_13_52_11b]|nr:MAG: hypothetical protein A2162_07025 [Deltaproteobacteria bacterium RBG_13_52_11b]
MKNRVFIHDHVVPTCLVLAFVLASIPCHTALSQVILDGQEKIKLDVPYEPSSKEVVGAMLEIARVGDTDVVYDLGCGDGRIVIAAAQKKGARGVGVDLDPERIKESLENARKANVADRVEFFQQDLFQTDIGKATVVMLYLWPEVNLKLRPKLLRELKPGTRVVSHSHDMESWEADQTMTSSEGHRVRLWVIPANVTGRWEWSMPGEKERYVLKLSQQFQKVSGTFQSGPDEISIKNFELRGDRLQFTVERSFNGQIQTLRFVGTALNHIMKGTEETMPRAAQGKRTWKANRIPSSMEPLD